MAHDGEAPVHSAVYGHKYVVLIQASEQLRPALDVLKPVQPSILHGGATGGDKKWRHLARPGMLGQRTEL